MVKRGPKRRKAATSGTGVEPLESRNIVVCGHRTSMRLEPSMWDAFEEIIDREQLTVNSLCSLIKERLESQERIRGDGSGEVTLTSAVRVFIAAYFRRASTDDGHVRAGHGGSDPFSGTPFDVRSQRLPGAPAADAADGSGLGNTEKPALSADLPELVD